jgi:hypothetical protein
MSARRQFVLRLEAKRGVDAIRALRRLLKIALGTCGLRCVAVEEIAASGDGEAPHA